MLQFQQFSIGIIGLSSHVLKDEYILFYVYVNIYHFFSPKSIPCIISCREVLLAADSISFSLSGNILIYL